MNQRPSIRFLGAIWPGLWIALIGLVLLILIQNVTAEKEPLWKYNTGKEVWSVAISKNGEYIAASTRDSNDNLVYLFYRNSSTPIWNHSVNGGIFSIAISSNGDYIVAGSLEGDIYLFHKNSSTPLWIVQIDNEVWSVDISNDGEYIVVGSKYLSDVLKGKVYLFHKNSSTPLWNYTTDKFISSVSISSTGDFFSVGSNDKKVYLFNRNNSIPIWKYETEDHVQSVAITSDGDYIVAGSYDNNIYLFHKNSSTPLWNFTSENNVYSVAISTSGEYIVAGSAYISGKDRGKVYLFHKNTSTPLWNYTTDNYAFSASISGDGKYISIGSFDSNIYFFERDSNLPIWVYQTNGDVRTIDVSVNGNSIIAGSDDKYIYFFERDSPPKSYIESITPSTALRGEEITFIGYGYDDFDRIIGFQWNSSLDGTVSNSSTFNISTLSIDTHTITFRVLNEFGEWSDEVTSNITILNNQPIPIIDLITPSPVEKGINISFHGSGQDIDGNITGYYWSSTIDGELSAEQDFNTSTLSLGHHTISFRIKDNDGLWSYIVSEELFVYTSPVAKAGDNITIEPYQIVQFVGIATDEDGSIVKYEWDFDGDGVFDWSLGENGRTTNVYNEEGEYTAVLRATDNDGFTSTAFRVINVTKGGTNGGGGDDDDSPAPSFIVATMIVVIVAIRRQVRT